MYICGRTLGSGGSGTVFLGTDSETGKDVAIKVFADASSIGMQAAATEYECAVSSAGPNTLKHYSLALMNGQPALIMELASISLHDWIQVCNTASSHQQASDIVGRVSQCKAYHNHCVHLDCSHFHMP